MVIYDGGEDLNGQGTLGFYLKPNANTVKGSIKYVPMIDIAKQLKVGFTGTNAEFIAIVDERAKARSKAIVDRVGQGIDFTSMIIEGQKIGVAKNYNVTSNLFPQQTLRLDRIVHTLNRNG